MNTKPNKTDKILLLVYFTVGILITLYSENLDEGLREPILITIIYVVSTLVVTYIIVYYLFPKFFPLKRIVPLLFWTLLVLAVAGFFELNFYRWATGKELITKINLNYLTWCVISSTQNVGLLIGILLAKKFYDSQLELEQKEKQKRENELRLLKSQIDPHFLFNNLNTVDALIDSDPNGAKVYLNHLSKLYRYLIRTKDDEVVDLQEEMEFAENYMYLIEKRFGRAYQFEIKNTLTQDNKLIPPGALQTVLENVVKHNSATEQEPIKTIIHVDNNKVVCSNNIRANFRNNNTHGTGLKNLMARYKYLTEEEVIIKSDDLYTISLPILNAVE